MNIKPKGGFMRHDILAPSHKMIRNLFTCTPDGTFRWKSFRARNIPVDGHLGDFVSIDRKKYNTAKIAYYFHTGIYPDRAVKYADGNRRNRRAKNLVFSTPPKQKKRQFNIWINESEVEWLRSRRNISETVSLAVCNLRMSLDLTKT
jgi:hypothetical protein